MLEMGVPGTCALLFTLSLFILLLALLLALLLTLLFVLLFVLLMLTYRLQACRLGIGTALGIVQSEGSVHAKIVIQCDVVFGK